MSEADTVTECIKLTPAEESNSERPMTIVIDLEDQLWKEPKQNSRHVMNKEKLRLKHFDIKFYELLANAILVVFLSGKYK